MASDKFERRKFLGGLLSVGGVGLVAGLRRPSLFPVTGTRPDDRITLGPTGQVRVGTLRGPDGLPVGSVEGYLISGTSDRILLQVPGRSDPVAVAVSPQTVVNAHGVERAQGALSLCRQNDYLLVGTAIGSGGVRSGKWIIANFGAFHGYVSALPGGARIAARPAERALGAGVSPESECAISYLDSTTTYTKTQEARGSTGDLSVGDRIYFTGMADQPAGMWPSAIWAFSVHLARLAVAG